MQRLRSLSEGRRKPRILLCITGSVATVKVPRLALMLSEFAEVRIVGSQSSFHFLTRAQEYDGEAYTDFKGCDPPIEVFSDQQEWKNWSTIGDPVMHIHMRNWADLLLIAPLTANTLGKLANGLCDNLMTCVARAWDFELPKPFIVCPAMNTHMWNHPLTKKQLMLLEEIGVQVIPPISKTLACGDTGTGAMADVDVIRQKVLDVVNSFTVMARQNMPPPVEGEEEHSRDGMEALRKVENNKKEEKKEVAAKRPAESVDQLQNYTITGSVAEANSPKRQKQAA